MMINWEQLAENLRWNWLGGELDLATITEDTLSRWTADHAEAVAEREVRALTEAGAANPWEKILRQAKGNDLSWMENYGLPVREEERALARFLFQYPAQRRRTIGEHLVEALLHGFVSQNRDRRQRKLVRLNYCLGQEALAQEVLCSLEERGLQAIVQRPQCLTWSGAYAMAHSADRAACLSEESFTPLHGTWTWCRGCLFSWRRRWAPILP